MDMGFCCCMAEPEAIICCGSIIRAAPCAELGIPEETPGPLATTSPGPLWEAFCDMASGEWPFMPSIWPAEACGNAWLGLCGIELRFCIEKDAARSNPNINGVFCDSNRGPSLPSRAISHFHERLLVLFQVAIMEERPT